MVVVGRVGGRMHGGWGAGCWWLGGRMLVVGGQGMVIGGQ